MTKTIKIKIKTKTKFRVAGQGVPLLCIPGFGSATWIFDRLAERLKEHYHLVLVDNRGMGRSPLAIQPYRLDDLASDVIDLMDDLGHERFGVIGLSMGGFIAQLMALQVPSRIGALVLLCTSSAGPEFSRIFPGMTEQQVRSIYAMEPSKRVQAALSTEVCPLLKTKYPEVYHYVMAMRSREPEDFSQVMLQYFAVNTFMERSLALENICCPTLILAGDSDTLVPLENATLLRDKIPGALLAVIEETDHLFFLEKSAEVATKIREFLG